MHREQSASAIAEELGERLKQARLNCDLTQTEVAERAGIARKTVLNAEKGSAQLENFVAILLALDLAEQLDLFLPKQPISPLQLAKLQGKKRKRASGNVKASRRICQNGNGGYSGHVSTR
ncbi:helix-turn-helix transcriptional regulator [Nitrincola sp. A-D6]|uniref:helix-turn-helix transcriptional regulator n=1 Tax=Nitrincola sp. A-D6 TaxID=1545442 RepID=UPI000B2EC8FC|nr:helix-turn-helix transcriptional regulator [Nitrincola sp. A-D6]